MKIGAGVARPKKGAWPSLGVPRELHDAVEGDSWESEVGVPAPALLPTCSVTLGRSLADSGLQALALHGGGARSPGIDLSSSFLVSIVYFQFLSIFFFYYFLFFCLLSFSLAHISFLSPRQIQSPYEY